MGVLDQVRDDVDGPTHVLEAAGRGRLLAEAAERLGGELQRGGRIHPAVQTVAGDLAGNPDQPPPYRALFHDLDVRVDPPHVRQGEIQAGDVRQPADLLQLAALLEPGLERAVVDRHPLLPEIEHGLVEQPVALLVQILRAKPGRDARHELGPKQEAAQHRALGLLTLRESRAIRQLEQVRLSLRHQAPSPTRSRASSSPNHTVAPESRRETSGGGKVGLAPTAGYSSAGSSWLVTIVNRPSASRVRTMR